VEYVFNLTRPHDNSWHAYELRVVPEGGSLGVPSWVEAWSTNRDDLREYGNRTLYLSDIAFRLTNEITSKQVLAKHYLLIGRYAK